MPVFWCTRALGATPTWFLPLAGLSSRLMCDSASYVVHSPFLLMPLWPLATTSTGINARGWSPTTKRGERWRPSFYSQVGQLDRSQGALGTANEAVIKNAVGPQIAELYGTMMRSVPSYFVNDDHDYFENDEARPNFVTMPPAKYQLDFARFVRDLYLPEFLPDSARPLSLSGTGAGDRAPGVSESFGTFSLRQPGRGADLRLRALPLAQGAGRGPRTRRGREVVGVAHTRRVCPPAVAHPFASFRLVGG